MANRQDSGSNSAHQNQRPNAHNEDSIPEMSEDTRNMADESEDDDFEDAEELDEEEEGEDETF
jgi:hypothetical protein